MASKKPAASTASTEQKYKTRKELEEIKAKVFEFEKKNCSNIVVFRSAAGWWKMGGASALIYYHRVAKKIGRSPRLKTDTDFFSKFREGVISIKDVESLRKKLEKEMRMKTVRDTESVKIFSLGYSLTKDEIREMRVLERENRKKVNEMIVPRLSLPEVYFRLCELVKITYERNRKGEPVQREALGMEMFHLARDAIGYFTMAVNGTANMVDGLNRCEMKLEILMTRLMVVNDLEIWEATTCMRCGEKLTEAIRMLRAEIRRQKQLALEKKEK